MAGKTDGQLHVLPASESERCAEMWLRVLALAVTDYVWGSGANQLSARFFLRARRGSLADWRRHVCDMAGISEGYLRRVVKLAEAKKALDITKWIVYGVAMSAPASSKPNLFQAPSPPGKPWPVRSLVGRVP